MHLFSKENIWSNPHASCIHADKYNNSVNRIISKEEEREDPRRELQSSFQLESKSVSIHSTCNPASFQSSHAKTTILHTELILLQEISKKYYNYKAHPVHTDRRHPPISVPHASKHSIRQNPATRPLQYTQASSNSRQQKQHSKWQPASMQPLQQFPGKLHKSPLGITEFYQEK